MSSDNTQLKDLPLEINKKQARKFWPKTPKLRLDKKIHAIQLQYSGNIRNHWLSPKETLELYKEMELPPKGYKPLSNDF